MSGNIGTTTYIVRLIVEVEKMLPYSFSVANIPIQKNRTKLE
jgi:hypothetical protein